MPRSASDLGAGFRPRIGRRLAGLVALCAVAVLPGCASFSEGFAKVEQETAARNLAGAQAALDGMKLSGADTSLNHLNKGMLYRLQGDYAKSNAELDEAKRILDESGAISISEQALSVAANDTMKAYEGDGNEQLLIYAFKALNYLQAGDVDAAAVEARQFDIKHRLVMEKNPEAKFLTGAFARYLNGMVYEAVGERDSARIEYTKALEGYKLQAAITGFGPPNGLLADLARVDGRGSRNGRRSAAAASDPNSGEVVFFLHNGLGPSAAENIIQIPNPNPAAGVAILRVALPKFVERPVPVARVEVSAAGVTASSEVAENVNALARKSLDDRLPVIQARAVARLVAKNVAAAAVKKQADDRGGGLAGLLVKISADVAAVASERADTRTWALLPGNVQLARLSLPAGKHTLRAVYYGMHGGQLATREFPVEVRAGRRAFVSDYYVVAPPPAQAR